MPAPEDTYELVPLGSPAGTYNLTDLRIARDRQRASKVTTAPLSDMAGSQLPWRTRSGPH
ncbi:hypothetical protein ACFV3E_41795 [Streptomyces sp. NPDC059718]